jgi:hypothetical protein
MKWASNRKALAICDRCGLTVPNRTLINQVIDRKPSGIMVCRKCNDIDQEQLQLGTVKADDAIALRITRPDTEPGRLPNDPFVFPFLNSP